MSCGVTLKDASGARSSMCVSDPLPAPILAHLHLLVVDDSADNREIVAFVLVRHGATVTEAESADAALLALAVDSFDVVISDLSMPEHDGFWLLDQIRDRQTTGSHALPVLALTALCALEDRTATEAAGFCAHLCKPVDIATLVGAVASAAGRA